MSDIDKRIAEIEAVLESDYQVPVPRIYWLICELRKARATHLQWRPFSGECCFCGNDAEVLTASGKDKFAFDGDEARCVSCRQPGAVFVPGDDEPAYIRWHDEPGCGCEWCKMAAALEE